MMRALLVVSNRVKNSWFWIWRQQGTPAERARGLAVGIFSGCFPFFGFQSLIGIFLASLLKGNRLMAVAATWISNPLTYLPLYWLNYKVGLILLGGENKFLNLNNLSQQDMWRQGWFISSRILFGSFVVGLLSGLLLGYVSYRIFKSFNKAKRF